MLESLAAVDHPVVLLAHPRLVARCAEHGIDLEAWGPAGGAGGEPGDGAPAPEGTCWSTRHWPTLSLIASALHARGVVTDSGGLQKEAFPAAGALHHGASADERAVETVEPGVERPGGAGSGAGGGGVPSAAR